MTPTVVLAIVVGVSGLLACAMLLIQPFIVRRGLLFGVYIGEHASDEERARTIRRQWVAAMVATFVISALLGGLLLALGAGPAPLSPVISILALGAGTYVVYLRAHFQARHLAVPGAPLAAASLAGEARYSLALPLTSVATGLAGGISAIGYAWMHYAELPAEIPTHFGLSGRPDAWSPRSFASVMMLPVATLLMGAAVGVMACLVARAKRAIRYPDAGVSVAAQQRFRQVSANLLAGVGILMTLMLTVMSIYSVRTALGAAAGMPLWLMAIVGVMLVVSVGGSLYIALRYGQGGARLESRAASAPLTNGLADNTRWVLGVFYVNHDDPSMFVEKRFGLGYTINFGNPKAIALLLLFLVIIAVIVVGGLTMPQTTVAPGSRS